MPFQKPQNLPYASGDRKQKSHKDFLLDVLDGHVRVHRMLLELAGPEPEDSGIIRFGDDPDKSGLVEQQTVAGMTVKFNRALGFVNKCPFYIGSVTNSATLSAPSGDPRVDTVYIDPATQTYLIATGVEDASPVAPVIDETLYTKVAEIYFRVGGTAIYDAANDTSTDHYIVPMQNFYEGHFPPKARRTYGTIFIPGGYMTPTNDVAPSVGVQVDAFDLNALTFHMFESTTAQVASFEFCLPYDFDNAFPINFQVHWSTPSTSSADIDFELYFVPLFDNIGLDDRNIETSGSVNDNNGGTANKRRISPLSDDIELVLSGGGHYLVIVQVPAESGQIEDEIRIHSITMRYTKEIGD